MAFCIIFPQTICALKYDFNSYKIADESPEITVYAVKSKYNRNPAVDMFLDHVKKNISEDSGITML